MKIHSSQDTMIRGPRHNSSILCISSVRLQRSTTFAHFRLFLWLHQKNHTRSPIKCLFYQVIYIILYKLSRFSNLIASSITAPFPSRSSRYSSTSALSTGRLPGILRTEYPTLVFINFRYAEKTNFMQRDLKYSMQCVVGKFPSLGKENLK